MYVIGNAQTTLRMRCLFTNRKKDECYMDKMKSPKWEREEVVLLVVEYFRTRDLSRQEVLKSIAFLSRFLKRRAVLLGNEVNETFRNETGIEMKFGNIKSLDKKYVEAGGKGLKASSKLDRLVVEEYCENADRVKGEAYEVLMRYNFS